jgi:hypothetical protein
MSRMPFPFVDIFTIVVWFEAVRLYLYIGFEKFFAVIA